MIDSESPSIVIHHKYHAHNGQYIALLSDQGNNILMSSALPDHLSIPTIDTGMYTPSEAEIYRVMVCDILGVASVNTHVIEEYVFDQQYSYDDKGFAVSLTIIQLVSDDVDVLSPLLWVNWRKNNKLHQSTPDHPAVSDYLISFLDTLGQQTQRNALLPWYCFDFSRKLEPSLSESLKTAGYEILGDPEQVRFSCRSATYRIPSKPDDLFFKACPVGSNETHVAQALCKIFPNDFVSLICVVPELNGIVTVNAGKNLHGLIFRTAPSEERSDKNKILDTALKSWADFQQRSSVHVPQLKASGLQVRDKAWVLKGTEELRVYCRDHELLPEEQLARLEVCDRIIEETFALWEASGIPETVVHGDFCEDNLAQPNGPGTAFVAFDFCTAFIGCPLFDLRDPRWSALHTRQATYLQCWEHYCGAHKISMLAKVMKPMEYLIGAIVIMRDKTLWTEDVSSEILSSIESLLEKADEWSCVASDHSQANNGEVH